MQPPLEKTASIRESKQVEVAGHQNKVCTVKLWRESMNACRSLGRSPSVYVVGKGQGETEAESHSEAPMLRPVLLVFITVLRSPHPVFS